MDVSRPPAESASENGGSRALLWLIVMSAAVSVLLGLVVLVGWHLKNPTLIQVLPGSAPMQYNTALAFLLAGLALAAVVADKKVASAIAASLVCLTGLLTLAEYIFGLDLKIDQLFMRHVITAQTSIPGRMTPNTALGFVLAGATLLLLLVPSSRSLRAWLPGTLAAVVTGLGFIAFAGSLSGLHTAYGWGHLTRMAVHTSVGFIVLGVGLIVGNRSRAAVRGEQLRCFPLVIAILFLTVAVSVWQAEIAALHRATHEVTHGGADGLASAIELSVGSTVDSLDRMALRWDADDGTPEPKWRLDARAHTRQIPGLMAMEWVDTSYVVRWVEPHAGNEMVVGLNLAANAERRPLMELARSEGVPVVTPVTQTLQGKRGFYVVVPTTAKGKPDGFLLAVMALDDFMPGLTAKLDRGLAFRVLENGKPVWSEGGWAEARGKLVEEEAAKLPGKRSWTVAVTPGPGMTSAKLKQQDVLTLAAFFLLAIVAALAAHFAQAARRRSKELELHQDHLNELVEERTASLLESETRFQRLLENAPVPMCHVDEEGELVYRNRRFVETFGYTKEDVPNLEVWWEKAYPDPEYRAWVLENWSKAVEDATREGHDIAPITYNVTCKDGRTREIEISGVMLGDSFLATFFDMTVRNRLERQLKTSEQMLRLVIDTIPVRVFWKDWNGRYLGCNRALAQDAGKKAPDEVVGRTDDDLAWADFAEKYREDDRSVMDAGEARLNFEEPVVSPQGEMRVVRTSKVPLRDDDDKVVGLLGLYEDITERRRAEEERLAIQERFQNMFELGLVGNAITSPEKGWVAVNDRLCDMLGYSEDELKSMTWAQLTHPDDLAADEKQFGRVLAGEIDAYELDKRFISKDGRLVYTKLAVHAVRKPDGEVDYVLALVEDITDRVLAVEQLKSERAQLTALFDSMDEVIYVADPETYELLYVNPAFEARWGEDRIGQRCYKVLHGREEPCPFCTNPEIFGDNLGRVHVWEHLNALNGRWYQCTDKAIRWADGTWVRFELATDVTERREAARVLELALRAGKTGVFDFDVVTGAVTVSPEFETMLGYQPGELPMTYDLWYASVHQEDRERAQGAVQAYLDGTAPEYVEQFRFRTKSGGYKWVQARGEVVQRDSQDRPTRLIGTHTDISEQQEMVERLEQSNRELEQFAYVASHDLQEPLRMVSSYTQLLERRYKDELDDDARDFIHYAVDGATRMQRLIQDLLTFSRITTRGKQLEPVSAHEALGEALANLSTSIEEHKALVTNDELPEVLADYGQLVALFQNLVGNGIKFHGEMSPRVHVSARSDNGAVVFCVQDNGIGMDPGYSDRIFVIFQRLHTRSDYPGTGIGLAVCKKIVERHGGKIWLETEPEKGSRFYFSLPTSISEGGSA